MMKQYNGGQMNQILVFTPPVYKMEFNLQDQGHTLGCLIRQHLDDECEEEFGSCTVVHPKDTHLFVCTPTVGHVRRALLSAKDDLKKLEVFLNKKSENKKQKT